MATTAAAAEKRDRTKERSLLNFPGKSFCFHVLYAACKTVRLKDSDKLSWSVYEFTEAVSNLSKIAILLFFGVFFFGGGGAVLYLPLTLLLCVTVIVATHVL